MQPINQQPLFKSFFSRRENRFEDKSWNKIRDDLSYNKICINNTNSKMMRKEVDTVLSSFDKFITESNSKSVNFDDITLLAKLVEGSKYKDKLPDKFTDIKRRITKIFLEFYNAQTDKSEQAKMYLEVKVLIDDKFIKPNSKDDLQTIVSTSQIAALGVNSTSNFSDEITVVQKRLQENFYKFGIPSNPFSIPLNLKSRSDKLNKALSSPDTNSKNHEDKTLKEFLNTKIYAPFNDTDRRNLINDFKTLILHFMPKAYPEAILDDSSVDVKVDTVADSIIYFEITELEQKAYEESFFNESSGIVLDPQKKPEVSKLVFSFLPYEKSKEDINIFDIKVKDLIHIHNALVWSLQDN